MKKALTAFIFVFIPLLCAFSATYSGSYEYYYKKNTIFSIKFFEAESTDLSSDSSSIIQSNSTVSYGTYDKSENYSYVADIVSFSNFDYTCYIKLRYTAFDSGSNLINMKLKCIYYDKDGNSNEVVGAYSSCNRTTGVALLPFIEIEPFCPTWTAEGEGTKIAMLYALADPNGSGSGDYAAKVIMEITEP